MMKITIIRFMICKFKIKKVIFIQINIDDLNINFIKKGEGKATLILPGWGTTINTYVSLINDISKYSTVYCLDMPGFGESQEPHMPWNLDNYVEFISKFVESQNINNINLIGHSNGGRILIKLASKRNLRFKINKIILIGSTGIVHKKSLSIRLKICTYKMCKKILQLNLIKKSFPNALTKLKNVFGSEDYKSASPVLKQTLVKLINEDLRNDLPNIRVPTLLIWGENDTATPLSDAKIMQKLIPDAGLVSLENCSHYVFIENSIYVNTIISRFLKGGI